VVRFERVNASSSDQTRSPADPAAIVRSRPYRALLVLSAVVGLIVSVAAWGFLELLHQIQYGLFTKLPDQLGYDSGAPMWWYVVVLALAGLATAAAIMLLPGPGGHVPALGLKATGTPAPIEVPGVILAALAGVGGGVVLGPEAPLIAMGGGLAVLSMKAVRKDAPDQTLAILAAAGACAALAMIFESPLISAIIMIEAAGLGGAALPLILLPALLAAGIGSLTLIGMGSWTGLSTSNIAISALPLPHVGPPDIADLAWTIPLAIAVSIGVLAIFWLARRVVALATSRPMVVLPVFGILIAGLAIAFHEIADHGVQEVLFSGQDGIGSLVAKPGAWSLSALALLLVFKGLAYSVSLSAFRGGPIFPAMFLGAAAGLMAADLPGMEISGGVAVCMAAALAAGLRLPLAAVLITTVLTMKAGSGVSPLIILAAVVAYLTAQLVAPSPETVPGEATAGRPEPVAASP
jgi:H+/Cl- antiporter ClcA